MIVHSRKHSCSVLDVRLRPRKRLDVETARFNVVSLICATAMLVAVLHFRGQHFDIAVGTKTMTTELCLLACAPLSFLGSLRFCTLPISYAVLSANNGDDAPDTVFGARFCLSVWQWHSAVLTNAYGLKVRITRLIRHRLSGE